MTPHGCSQWDRAFSLTQIVNSGRSFSRVFMLLLLLLYIINPLNLTNYFSYESCYVWCVCVCVCVLLFDRSFT